MVSKNTQEMQDINLIRKIAWSFHQTTGLEWEDLFQEAALAYCEAMQTYNEEKGKISTHVWHCMHRRLKNYLREQDLYKLRRQEGNDANIFSIDDVTIETTTTINDWWEALTEDAYTIAKVVLASPTPYLEHDSRPQSINRVRRVMRNYGWEWRRTQRGLNDLRIVYSKRETNW